MKALKVHEFVWGTDHVHENPDLLAQLTDRPSVVTAGKGLLIHQDSEVASEFSEKRFVEGVFFYALGVLFAANKLRGGPVAVVQVVDVQLILVLVGLEAGLLFVIRNLAIIVFKT